MGNTDVNLPVIGYGETPLDLINIVKPVANYGEAPLNPININKQAAIDLSFGNLQAGVPNDEASFRQTGFEANGLLTDKVSSNPILAPSFDLNKALGRKRRTR